MPIDSEDSEIVIDSKTKTTLFGGLLITCGVGCFCMFLFSYWVNTTRVSSPTATTEGTITNYTPAVWISDTSKQSASCSGIYRVEGKTYPFVSTCGADIFPFAERAGDKVGIIYQTTDPSKNYVNRSSFFNFLAFLGFPLLIFGWLLLRKGMRMPAGNNED